MGIVDMDECHEVVSRHIDKVIAFIVLIAIGVSMHFIVVIYSHWKSYGQNFQP